MPAESNSSQRFVLEAREHLAALTAALMALERSAGDPQAHIGQMLRNAHGIKGGAGFLGRRRIEQLAHAVETVLENLRDGRVAPRPEHIDALLAAIDRIGALVDDQEHSDEADISQWLEHLRPLVEPAQSVGLTAPAVTGTVISPEQVPALRFSVQPSEFALRDDQRWVESERRDYLYGLKLDWFQCERECGLDPLEVAKRLQRAGLVLTCRLDLPGAPSPDGLPEPPLWYRAVITSALAPQDFARQLAISCAGIVRLENVPSPEPAPAAPAPAARPSASTSLRISVALIDRLMGLAGELVLVRNQALHSAGPNDVSLRRLLRRLDTVTDDVQSAALQMRMQPVGTLFDRFPRLVRDLGRQLGKIIELKISGAEVELDKTIIEMLADPLTHLVRNCCDHGIETPQQRSSSGKPAGGLIQLSARQERGQMVIEIRDDGRGIDGEAVKRKALQQGLRRAEELERMNAQQLFELILLPGFSTASGVTDLSGRGVGMDVVKTNLDQVGGFLEIDSAPGRGTTFVLRLPLTLAIMPCLMMRCSGQRYAMPQRDVEEIVLINAAAGRARIELAHDQEVLRLRGRLLPVVRLARILDLEPHGGTAPAQERAAVEHSAHSAEIDPAKSRPGAPDRQAPPAYIAVLRSGMARFGLVVDEVTDSEDIVVKPLPALLRRLGVYSGATLLGDGTVALILSAEGLARHGGALHRPMDTEVPALPAEVSPAVRQILLIFKCGPAELLALPQSAIQRVISFRRRQIEAVGGRELVTLSDQTFNILRLDRLLDFSACPDEDAVFLIVLRERRFALGILASQIVDTPTVNVELDVQALRADGVLGTALLRGQMVVFLDHARLIEMWAPAAALPQLSAAAPQRILVVEDTQFFRQLIGRSLHEAGYHIVTAENGREGLARLAEGTFDLIVSDIEMPEMDGLSFARHVRGASNLAHLPMLALTTLSSAADRQRITGSGFDRHEIKFDQPSFIAAVRELLAEQRSAAVVPGGAAHA